MTAPTPTAATPEELAARIELVGTEAAQEEIRKDIAAAIRQHSEALRAENERLTKERDELRARDHSWAATFSRLDAEANEDARKLAASQERERGMREALSKALDAADEVARAKGRLASVRGASDQKRRNMEEWVLRTTVALENALMFARAALQPQETADVR